MSFMYLATSLTDRGVPYTVTNSVLGVLRGNESVGRTSKYLSNIILKSIDIHCFSLYLGRFTSLRQNIHIYEKKGGLYYRETPSL